MNNPLFSIILPIYKVEEYLQQSIESVLMQTEKNYELILVDDGSPDKCPFICDEYSKKYSCISVLHKENGGLSSARNAGVDIARGEYIIFLDSDDYWGTADFLKKISVEADKETDVIFWGCTDYSSITGKMIEHHPTITQKEIQAADAKMALYQIIEKNAFPGAAWTVAVKRTLLLNEKIHFIEGIKAEDIDWLLNVFIASDSYTVVDSCAYIYRKYRIGSITNTADVKSFENIMSTVQKWIEKNYENKQLKEHIYAILVKPYLCAVLIAGKMDSEMYFMCKTKIKKYHYLMRYSCSSIIRCFRLLPIDLLSKFLIWYNKSCRF